MAAQPSDGDTAGPTRSATLASDDGLLTYTLAERPSGLYVRRSEHKRSGERVDQAMRFPDEASFLRWCEVEESRFTHPLLHARLKRSGCALFQPAR